MKSMAELQDERKHKIKRCEDILEECKKGDRTLTADEKIELPELREKVTNLDTQIEELTELQHAATLTTKLSDSLKAGNHRATSIEQPTGEAQDTQENRKWNIPVRGTKLKAFRGATQAEAEEKAYAAGMWAIAVFYGNPKAQRWCENHGIEIRAMGGNVQTAGGALVPDVMSSTIINLREEYGVFRQHTSVVPMGSDSLWIPRRASGPTMYYVGQNEEITESDAAVNQVHLQARKLAALTRIASELDEDAVIDIGDFLAQEFALGFATSEDDAGFKGDGSQTYGGIVGINVKIIDGNHGAGVVDAVSGNDQFSEIDAVDLNNLMAVVPQFALRGAQFFCSSVCKALVFDRLMAAAGGNTTQTLSGAIAPSYLGYPIIVSQSMPTTTAALNNLVMLLFGNLAQASTLGDRRGMTVSRTADRYWEFDQIGVKATQRYDINVHDLGDGTTAGPIACLIGNT